MHKIRRQSDLTLSHSKERAPVVWWKEEDDVMRFDRGAKTITDCCELRFGYTSCKLHPSKFVRNEESWELLKRKGFIKGSCFIELEKDGECIAIKCGGLPLAEVVIVGVLVQYTSNNCYCKW
nr:putative late blight resistance protein homolog R1A-10 [Ipomoea batatas]